LRERGSGASDHALGLRSLDLWRDALPETPFNGSLVVSHARDRADFERFARLATGHKRVSAKEIAELEPDLDGRFHDGLYFAQEGHVDPRRSCPRYTTDCAPPA